MTIGNLSKEIQRCPSHNAQILVGYLPTMKLEHIANKAARWHCLANLFHASSGNGALHCGHPLVACYIGDYPEQVLVMGTKTGECPKCNIPADELGSKGLPFELQYLDRILDVLGLVDEDPSDFAKTHRDVGNIFSYIKA
ncbi:hypothetical protein EV424DRAFT_1344602 [Suillus variegatus]|nr:hypothetical protein EV424DRAFT_1344602 [Suillus variegatus]